MRNQHNELYVMKQLRMLLGQYRGLRKENYILFFGRIVTNMGSMIYPVLTMILSQKLYMDATQVAFTTVCSGIIVLPAGMIGGKIADRYNKKHAIILCDCVSVCLFILCGCIPLSIGTIVLLFIASAFQSAEGPMYNALIADITTMDNREKAYSLMYLGGNLGLVLSPTLAGLLFKNYLWLSFILSGAAIACSTLLIFFQVKDISKVVDGSAAAEYQTSRDHLSLWEILIENPLILICLVVMGIYSAAYSQNSYLLPLDMGRIHGEDSALIYGSIFSLNCIEVVFLTPILTAVCQRIPQTVKNLIGMSLLLSGYVAFLMFLGRIPAYYFAVTLFTMGEIFVTVANGPYLADRIPESHRGRVNGFMSFLQNLLYGILMMTLGNLYDQIGNEAAWVCVFILLGIAVVCSIVLIPMDKRCYQSLYQKSRDTMGEIQ